MFVSPAFAQAAGAQQDPAGGIGFMVTMVIIFIIFYFFLIRPQNKKMRQHQDMLASIRRGDKVVTGGGIIGTITKVESDTEITVEIAPNVKVRVQRALVSAVLSKSEPVRDETKPQEGGGDDKSTSPPVSGLKKLLGGK